MEPGAIEGHPSAHEAPFSHMNSAQFEMQVSALTTRLLEPNLDPAQTQPLIARLDELRTALNAKIADSNPEDPEAQAYVTLSEHITDTLAEYIYRSMGNPERP